MIQSSADAIYLARHVGLRAGLPIGVPALTLNRLCGSGLQAMLSAAQSLRLGEATYALAGGSENMTQSPHVIRGARKGFSFGANVQMEDSLWSALTDSYGNTPMAITAENLAKQYGVSREECDEFALASQTRALESQAAGYFAEEIVPVQVPGPKGTTHDRGKGRRPARGTLDGKTRQTSGAFRKRRRRDARERQRHHRRRGRARADDGEAGEGRRREVDRPHD